MFSLSKTSEARLQTCHKDLQAVCRALIKQYDFSVLEGHRTEQAQNAAFHKGTSKLCWPRSAHNKMPSMAVDIAPYPIDWHDISRFKELITRFEAVARLLREQGQISSHFIYGGLWPTWQDWPHIEIQKD